MADGDDSDRTASDADSFQSLYPYRSPAPPARVPRSPVPMGSLRVDRRSDTEDGVVLLDIHQGDYDYLLDESPVAITVAPVQREQDPPTPVLGTRAVEESRPIPSTGMQSLQAYLHGRDSDTGTGKHEFDIINIMLVGAAIRIKKPGNPGAGRPKKGEGNRTAKRKHSYRKRLVADGRSSDASAGIGSLCSGRDWLLVRIRSF
jgi:hypothetical protein